MYVRWVYMLEHSSEGSLRASIGNGFGNIIIIIIILYDLNTGLGMRKTGPKC